MIKIFEYKNLDVNIKSQLDNFIYDEFGHIPIVAQTEWATPNWTIIYFENDEIATFYNIVLRTVSIDSKEYQVAGLNNVITPAGFRGKGYSTKTLRETAGFMRNELETDLSLLLCADDLLPFYSRLGWYKIDCPVYFNQTNEKRKLWTANTMLLSKGKFEPTEIDLKGFPW